jgi:hypothetical protein
MIDTNKIDFTKPLQTCSGLKVRILSTAFELGNLSGYPVIAEVEGEGYLTYTSAGKQYNYDSSEYDLQNIPEETFEQKVERFKRSEFYISDKEHQYGNEIVIWHHATGFEIFTSFENAMESVYFK